MLDVSAEGITMDKRSWLPAPPGASPWFPAYYGLIVAGGLTLLAWHLPALAGTSPFLLLLWLALILITDAAPVNLPGGGFITVSSTLDYAGILILGPVPTAVAEFASTLVLQLGVQRRPVHKAVFNACAFAGTVMVAGWVYGILGGVPGQPLDFPHVLLPILGMGMSYYALNTMIVSLVIALSEGRKTWQIWQVNYIWTIFHMVASLPFGAALAVAYFGLGTWGVVLFIFPLLLARYSFKLYIETKRDLLDFAGVLAGVIDEFDPYTRKHSQRVSRYSANLARELGLSEREVERVEYGGLLHDIGKIKMSQRDLILKPGRLTPEERQRICLHAGLGADILERVRAFRRVAPLVRYHHERLDGRGYHNLPAKDLPLGARIVMTADAFDAMTSDRVYRKALTLEDSLAEMRRCAGEQFDPEVVVALERLVRRGEIVVGEGVAPAEPEPLARPGLVNAGLV
jgi:putative nucleotidyltransferase with HDIG domain